MSKTTAAALDTITIALETPIKRGDTEIKEITLRKPLGGALRGVNLRDVLELNNDAIAMILPRISEPALHAQDIEALEPFDRLNLGGAVASFFMPKQVQMQVKELTQNP